MCDLHDESTPCTTRREALTTLRTSALLGALGALFTSNAAEAAPAGPALSKSQQAAMTADEILAMMKRGNERFRAGKTHAHNELREQREATVAGQYPAAMLLSCMDSRAPAEVIMDLRVGDIFNARVAGNVINEDMLGSMEFACKVAGSKVIVVMGHTRCGAVKGTIAGAKLGHLTGLLERIRPAIDATTFTGERTAENYAFVDAVAEKHVALTVASITERSTVLAELVRAGTVKVVGAMYDLESGALRFLA
jgi:carbonic anhydrase